MVAEEVDSTQESTEEEGESDRSVFRESYWILIGQFRDSDSSEDKIKSAIIAISILTGMLALTAGTTAGLVDSSNWPTAAALFLLGIATLVFAWLIGLGRLDGILVSE